MRIDAVNLRKFWLIENKKMSVIVKLCFVLAVVSLGAADIYPIYPKNEQSETSPSVEQDIQRIGRRLQAATKTVLFDLQGSVYPDGIYYVKVSIGDPPKEYFLDIDTGSDLSWLQCDAFRGNRAKTPHQWYKPRSGVSCKHLLCEPVQKASQKDYKCENPKQLCYYDIKYADKGTSAGFLIRDSFRIRLNDGTTGSTTTVFGCGYDQDNSLIQPQATDGVLGLNRGIASLPSQWEKKGLIKNVIGICIAGGGQKGGHIFFGDDHVPTSSMTWVPLLQGPNIKHYHVGATQMIYGEKDLVKHGDETIFDTGSSYTYFTQAAYSALVSEVKKRIGKQFVQVKDLPDTNLPLCWRGKTEFRSIADVTSYFKPLTLNFKSTSSNSRNAELEIRPEAYLIIKNEGSACLGILDVTEIIPNTRRQHNLIGDISFQGHLLVFDNHNNRIGWTRRDCTSF